MGGLALIVGLSGWFLPYEWNLLRLRRRYAGLLAEEANRKIPKIVGSILIAGGALLILHAAGVL
jgi:hypothetical protein